MLIAVAAVLIVSSVAFVISLYFLFRKSGRNPLEYRVATPEGKRMVGSVAVAFVGIVSSITYLALHEIRSDLETRLVGTLNTVLETTQEATKIWVGDQERRINRLSRDPRFVESVQALVEQDATSSEILTSQSLKDIRLFFERLKTLDNSIGFFVVTPNGINIASRRDNNIGLLNPILVHRPELFARVLNGESLMIPAIPSDVVLDNQLLIKNRNVPPTMFFASPVRDRAGKVIAVLTERFDPTDAFSKILLLGRIGETGETYAFNSSGQLVSNSRFDAQLREMGVLADTEQSILSVQLVVPSSGDVFPGQFIESVQSALQKERGQNTTGFADYRGVRVIGSWAWDESLQLGFTTEMDFDEAFSPYVKARRLIFLVISVTLLIAISYSLMLLLLSARANNFLERVSDDLEQRVQERTQALIKSEHDLQVVVDTVPAPLYKKNRDGIYELVNSEYERVVGITKANVLGKTDKDVLPLDVAERLMATDRDIMEGGERVTLEEVVPDPNGEQLTYQTFKVPMFDEDESITGILGVSVDITDRKKMEEALKNTLNSLSFVQYSVDRAPGLILWANKADGRVIYANGAMLEFLSQDVQSILTINLTDVDSAVAEKGLQTFTEELETQFLTYETNIPDAHKQSRFVEVMAQLVRFGEEERIVFYGRDVTIRRHLENALVDAKVKAEEGNRSKSEFLASMSHEIRTPLNGVLGMIGLVRRTQLEAKQDEQLRIAQNSANSLLDIINDLLDFSKIEAQKLEVEELDFNVQELLGEIAKAMAFRAEEKGLEIILDLSNLRYKNIKSDPTRIRQLIVNLVGNAIKFTHQGEILIRASVENVNDQWMFTCHVMDTGIGIEEDKIEHLFERFTQADASTTRKFGGTGLGLAICKKLCHLMNGDIEVHSEVGKGSDFVFTVEVSESNQTIDALPKKDIRSMRVLVVDDLETNRIIFRSQLEFWGLEVLEVDQGIKALELLDSHPPDYIDIVLLDMNMPEMDGYELCKRIRSNPSYASLKLLLMTSTTDAVGVAQLSEIGLDGFFSKPVTPSDLHDALLVVSEHAQTLREHGTLVTSRYLQTLSRQSSNASDVDIHLSPDLKILLVEDNEINQMIVRGILEIQKLSCHAVFNGQEAIDYLKEHGQVDTFDLILMDCQMPVLDGYAATEHIRAGAAGELYQDIPIVAMTAHALQGDREKCLAVGMNDFVSKPVDEQEFKRVLARYSHLLYGSDASTQDLGASGLVSDETLDPTSVNWPEVLNSIDPLSPPAFAKYTSAYLAAMNVFLAQGSDVHKGMMADFRNQDFESIQNRAHGLKGSSANLGFMSLSQACSILESNIRDNEVCTALEIGVIKDLAEKARVDAEAIVRLNKRNGDADCRELSVLVMELIALLEDSEVVPVTLVNELQSSGVQNGEKEAVEVIVSQLNNFEYDEALAALKTLSAVE